MPTVPFVTPNSYIPAATDPAPGTSPPTDTPPGGAGGNWFTNLTPAQQSALVASGFDAVGAGLTANANANTIAANQSITGGQTLANMYNADQSRTQQQAQFGANATQLDPLAQQKSRQADAVYAALMGNARPFKVTPGDPAVANAMGTITGGVQIPAGGFGPDVMNMLTPQARANAEGHFYAQAAPASPNSVPPDLSGVGYGAAGVDPTLMAQGAQKSALMDQSTNTAQMRAAIMNALQQQAGGGSTNANSNSGTWGALAGIGGSLLSAYLNSGNNG